MFTQTDTRAHTQSISERKKEQKDVLQILHSYPALHHDLNV